MLAALARSSGADVDSPRAVVPDNRPAAKPRAAPERAPAGEKRAAPAVTEQPGEAESAAKATAKEAGAAAADEPVNVDAVIASPASHEPSSQPQPEEEAATERTPEKQAQAPGPETAKGLVARLRRQFVEGLPEGRGGLTGASAKPGPSDADTAKRRPTLEELRFRLSEFRTEILVRAAGRGKPSRRG
jgi:hypothetical protein